MDLIELPKLRAISGSNVVVPENQTWIVKKISDDLNDVKIEINGTTFTVFYNYFPQAYFGEPPMLTPSFEMVVGGQRLTTSLPLKAGDRIYSGSGSGDVLISYWMHELDFPTIRGDLIPVLRTKTLDDTDISFLEMTVPDNETWIIKLAVAYMETEGIDFEAKVKATINGTVIDDLLLFLKGSVGVTDQKLGSAFFNSTVILYAGDKIKFYTSPVTIIQVMKLKIAYWIAEQDF